VKSGLDPHALDGEPDLDQSLDWVYDAFWRLSSCRGVGMAPGRVHWTAIMQYAGHCEIDDPGEVDDFVDLIFALDAEFLKPSGAAAES